MIKNTTPEHIADLLLYEMRRQEKKGRTEPINPVTFLEKKKVYFTQTLLQDAYSLMLNCDFADKGPQKLYGGAYDYEKDIEGKNVKALVWALLLTEKGRYFVDHKQKMDADAIAEANKKSEKRRDRLISAAISVAVFLAGTIIKWLLFDKQAGHQ
jgi:hypothetical protein